jgi:hypothetical protein
MLLVRDVRLHYPLSGSNAGHDTPRGAAWHLPGRDSEDVLVEFVSELQPSHIENPKKETTEKETTVMESKPTHEQAQLHLLIYEERRDPRLREAREWFFSKYFADTLDEALRIAPPGTEAGTNFMMVISYWDQACALLNYGLLHDGLFFETNGEFFGVWDRIQPIIKDSRQRFSNKIFAAHIETAAKQFEIWAEERSSGLVTSMRQMTQQMRSQTKKAA